MIDHSVNGTQEPGKMSRKREERAKSIRRSLKVVEQLEGVALLDDGLWQLSGTAPTPTDPVALARVLTGDGLPSRQDLARLLGAREVVRIDVESVSRWHKAVTGLAQRRDIKRLLREGIPALRQLTLEDIRARISAAQLRLERISVLFESADSAAKCQAAARSESLDVETLAGALPARLHALADWPQDPLHLLLDAGSGADRALLGLASTAPDRSIANLAAVLLGMRHRSTAGRQSGAGASPEALPRVPHRAYQAGRCAPPFSAAIVALALDGATPLELPGGIPESAARRLARLAERVAVLYGVDAAVVVLRSLTSRWEGSKASATRFRKAMSRLKRLVRAAETMLPIALRSALEQRVVDAIRTLPRLRSAQARVLTQLFKEWIETIDVESRRLGTRRLNQVAYESLPLGLPAAVTAMEKAWFAAPRETDEALEEIERAQLALSLTHPGMDLAAPVWSSPARIEQLHFVAGRLDGSKLRVLWPQIVSLGARDLDELPIEFLRSATADLASAALSLGVVEQAAELESSVLERYLRTVSALQKMQMQSLARQSWFMDLFRHGGAPAAALTLALLTSIGTREHLDQRLASLHALARGFKSHGPLLERALEAWSTPAVHAPPPELDPLAEALGMSTEPLRRYLHFRRLAGHGEAFSKELLAPLGLECIQESQIAYVQSRLDAPDLSGEERFLLQQRLAALQDPEAQRGRRRKAVRRARNRFERALALFRSQSLERILSDVYCRLLSSLLREKVPRDAMQPGMRECLQLLSSDNRNWHLFVELLRDVLRGRALEDRSANREWLSRAERAGLNVDAWVRGLRATVDVGGETIDFASERDPFELMKMGSYFDTCLSVEGDDRLAATVVVNALDVNKQVIYGRRPDGAVVARKLIGATASGELAGYNTYVWHNKEQIAAALAGLVADFARSCGLLLSDTATPEVLHEGYWYDDGNESWTEFAESPSS
jgi:hypothetical protein